MTEPLVIATHNGAFHADDVFGLAVLLTLHPTARMVRTRDAAAIAAADMAVDVGGIWDAVAGRFDHHQKGFDGKRDNGTVYASAGLVWLVHGREYIRAVAQELPDELVEKVFAGIDRELVEHVDRADTGAAEGAPDYFGLSALLSAYNLTRQEEDQVRQASADSPGARDEAASQLRLEQFRAAVVVVQQLLSRLVAQLSGRYADEALVRSAPQLHDGRVLLLERSGVVWDTVVVPEMPEVLFVVYPDSTDQQYQVRTVPQAIGSFKARKDLPERWAGLRDADLAAVSGVADSVFCHNGRFIAGAGSKAGALRLAELALQA